MACLTDAEKDAVLDDILQGTSWYAALFSTILTSAAGGTECADGAYARQAISFNAASGGAATNDGLVLWPAFAGSFTCRALALYDDVSAGNRWMFLNLSSPVAMTAGQQARIQDLALIVTAV